MRSIQNQLRRGAAAEEGCCDEIEETAIQAKEKAKAVTERVGRKSRMMFFRGGFTHMMNLRNGTSIQSDVAIVGAQVQADKDAWYFGAGFDWSLTESVWGFMPITDFF